MSEVTEQQLEDMEALFVQTAASMTSDRGTITLHGLSPSTLYFADRPQRDVGHMMSSHFVANWAAGDNSVYHGCHRSAEGGTAPSSGQRDGACHRPGIIRGG
jgi:hypothetical protein